jgi:predicted 2-oxoglutarate/Fe(II)-dependent dioxygenase YbiX
MKITDYIKVYDDVIPLEILSSLIQWLNTQKFEQAETLGGLNRNVRRAECLTLSAKHNFKTNIHWYNYLRNSFICNLENYKSTFKNTNVNTYFDMQALKYEQTGFYNYHVDDCTAIPRQLTFIYLLNNDYEGGELSFSDHTNNEEIGKIEVQPNRLIIWPSNFLFPHGVKPVTKGKRYSIVAWAR